MGDVERDNSVTGYNHYPDCTCRWCVNHGRSRLDRVQLRNNLRRYDALSYLKANSANSNAGCYVNPNARCPVCGTAVFFYSNHFGSKVYFDDLGPPWPKHPCTDNPRRPIESTGSLVGKPLRRANGLTQELLSAARTAGLLRSSASQRAPQEWQLMVVVSIDRTGNKNTVLAEFLDAEVGRTHKFTYFSDVPLVEFGDFASKKGDQISFLHRDTLKIITFKEGSTVPADLSGAGLPPSPPSEVARVPPAKIRKPTAPPRKPSNQPAYDMTTAEIVHYHSPKMHVGELCNKLGPIVKTYSGAGTRKPRDVALRLNADGHRTVNGAHWTPRLTHFLLGLIFLKPPPTETNRGSVSLPDKMCAHKEPAPAQYMQLTQTDMARRLSVLGRVVVKKK